MRGSFSFLRTVPARKPRTECFCQPLDLTSASSVVPFSWRSSFRSASCFDGVFAERGEGGFEDFDFAELAADFAAWVMGSSLGYEGIWRRQDHDPAEALSASGVGKIEKKVVRLIPPSKSG